MRRWRLFNLCLFLGVVFCMASSKVGFSRVQWSWHELSSLFLAQAIDPIEEIEKQKDELEHLLHLSSAATTPLEGQVKNFQDRINKAQQDIVQAKKQTDEVAKQISQEEEKLADIYLLFKQRVKIHYKQTRFITPLTVLLSASEASEVIRSSGYQLFLERYEVAKMEESGAQISSFEQRKEDLESRQVRLASLQKELDKQAEFFRKEVKGAKAYQKELSSKIAVLSAQQQQIINARSGSFTTSVGDVPLADDFSASIGFKSQAPGNSFAVFSFGGFTHRKGMSQYGAKARAESGQSTEDILKAYYPDAQLKKDYSEPSSISVQGFGSLDFEGHYLQGIYEMPSSWHMSALKAQAVAARTYALRHTDNGKKSICTTEACQVFRNSKKGGDWEKAVNETKGWVLVDGSGNPVSTMYASTHGGYATTSGWDTTDKSGSGDWSSRSWEGKAKSPWLYKSWYTQAYSSNSAKCGRAHPWLSQEEMSDILNAWIVRKNANGADVGRIQPVTINECHVGGGGNPYSRDELRNLANNSGGAVTSISGVNTSHNSSAQTTSVTFNTNRGPLTVPGDEFKSTFNLRAPGYLSIPQTSFAFFNVEHKQ